MKRRRGAALIEMAAALLVIGPLLAGAFQYGRAYSILHDLENAVDEGARFGSRYPLGPEAERLLPGAVAQRVVKVSGVSGLRPEHVAVEILHRRGAAAEVSVSIRGYRLTAPAAVWVLDGKPSAVYPVAGPRRAGITTAFPVLSNFRPNIPLANERHIAYNENTGISPRESY